MNSLGERVDGRTNSLGGRVDGLTGRWMDRQAGALIASEVTIDW